MSRAGHLIGIEGIDAVGKKTQSSLLESWLRKHGHKCTLMSFPDYDTPIGRQIRGFLSGRYDFPPQVKHLLFAANRWEKASLIKRRENNGHTIIVNRYTESNLAYGTANGLSVDWLLALEAGVPKTDLVIVLDASAATLASRRPAKDSYEKDNELQRKARAAYLELAPRFGWKVIDATGEVKNIHDSIVAAVEKGLRVHRS